MSCTSDNSNPTQANIQWPHPSEFELLERMGRGAADLRMPTIHLYLLDTMKHMNPLYVEADLLSGDIPDSKQVVSPTGETFDGPYSLRALYSFKASDDISQNHDEQGNKYSASDIMINIPRQSLRDNKMIDVDRRERIRLPALGDIIELYDEQFAVYGDERYHDSLIGPYYFVVSYVNFGKTLGFNNYWIELVVKGEYNSRFDPARLVSKTSQIVPNSTRSDDG